MKRLIPAFAVAALIGGSFAAAAQGPGSSARFSFGVSSVQVDAAFYAPDGCQAIVSVGRGTPAGMTVDREAMPVTVVVGPDPDGCSGNPVARRVFAVAGVPPLANLVQIFFIGSGGELLKTEKVSIQPG